MNNNRVALGLIETYGLIGAIEGLDVALKSANVSLIAREFVKDGRVTIEITGDVSAVKAAVEAAGTAVEKLGTLITTHVIARSHDEVWEMLTNTNDKNNKQTKDKIVQKKSKHMDIDINKKTIDTKEEKVETIEKKKPIFEYGKNVINQDILKPKNREELESMKVQELRTVARKMELNSLTKKQIKFSKKEQLIQAILEHWKRR